MKLSGFSTALYSTWVFAEEHGVLFDAGDGVTSCLLQKSGKIRHIFISHADRDHITGLFQLIQLISENGKPTIYYPKDSGSFPAMASFSKAFDEHRDPPTWVPIAAGDSITVKPGLVVQAIANRHIEKPSLDKSLSYRLEQHKWKLKPEFHGMDGAQIGELGKTKGKAHTSDLHIKRLFGFTGDTPVETDDRWQNCDILMHEATFLTKAEIALDGPHNLHSSLDEVLAQAQAWNPGTLILSHFSSRYKDVMICNAVEEFLQNTPLPFPVKVLYPGHFEKDILACPDL